MSYHNTIKTMVEAIDLDNFETTKNKKNIDFDDEDKEIEEAVRRRTEQSKKRLRQEKPETTESIQNKKQDDIHSRKILLDRLNKAEEEARLSQLEEARLTKEENEKQQIQKDEKLKELFDKLSADEKMSLKSFISSKADVSLSLDFNDLRQLSAEDLMIIDKLISLPEINRPNNVFVALENIKAGEKAWNAMQDDDFNGAVKINYPENLRIPDAITTAMNKSDIEFWELIKNDEAFKKTIEKNGVIFNYKTFKLLEFNSYFRSTYMRKKVSEPLHLEMYTKAYEKTICQMQWFLYKQSILEGKAFTSGMISFHDPENHIFKLMDRYMELVSPKFRFLGSVRSLGRTKAYTRISSHYAGQTDLEGQQFGIDLFKTDPGLALPGNKSHILFGMRTNGMLFVKWEDYGTTFNPVEVDVSVFKHMSGYFKKHGKEDNPLLESREKTPKAIEEKFQELAENVTESEQALIKTHGISSMIKILESQSPSKAAEFKDYLVKTFGYKEETLAYRKGSEVILNTKNFTPNTTI